MKIHETTDARTGERSWWWWCEGCRSLHRFDDRWTFDGNLEHPTFSPSLLTQWEEGEEHRPCRCHVFITAGQVQYLGDCTHDLAGQTLPIADMPAGYFDGS